MRNLLYSGDLNELDFDILKTFLPPRGRIARIPCGSLQPAESSELFRTFHQYRLELGRPGKLYGKQFERTPVCPKDSFLVDFLACNMAHLSMGQMWTLTA